MSPVRLASRQRSRPAPRSSGTPTAEAKLWCPPRAPRKRYPHLCRSLARHQRWRSSRTKGAAAGRRQSTLWPLKRASIQGLEPDRQRTANTKIELRLKDPVWSMVAVHRELSVEDRLWRRIEVALDLHVVSRAVRPLRRLVRHTHLDCIGRTARPVNIGPPIISRPSVFSWLAVRTRCGCERLACSGSPRLYCRRCRRSATSAWPLRLLLIPQRPAIGYLRRYANSVRSTSRQGETARRSVDGTRCFSSSGRRQLRMNPQREEGPPSPVRGQARGRHRDSARKLIAPRPQGTLALSGTCSGFESSWKTLQGSASPSKVHITR
jgi:hypothetical protein